MADNKTHLAVIGGGPGGYTAAFLAADLGMEVTLVDPEENPGGVCLYRGCIPSKALLHVARAIHEARQAENWGVTFGAPGLDIERMRAWKNNVVETLTGGLGRLGNQRKVHHVRGKASFKDDHTLAITENDGSKRSLSFENAIIATGSRSSQIKDLPADGDRVWNSKHALDLQTIPNRLLVVGGGYIGLELGTVYAALGSEVTVVEMTPNLLPGVDRDLVRFLQKGLAGQFNEILLQTAVREAKVQKNGVKVTWQEQGGESATRLFDQVMVAVGRQANSKSLNLNEIGIEVDERGFIKVDTRCRTNQANIFAIGDVAGGLMLAHKAYHEARVAVEVIAGRKAVNEPAAVPAVVFTDPEIAWAGLTESQVKSQGYTYETARFPWAASGRAVTLGRSDGLTKLLIDPESERLLGVGMVGPGAGELIAEAVLAMEMGANITDIALTIHPHPTLSETFKEAAELFHGTATHYFRPKRKKKR